MGWYNQNGDQSTTAIIKTYNKNNYTKHKTKLDIVVPGVVKIYLTKFFQFSSADYFPAINP